MANKNRNSNNPDKSNGNAAKSTTAVASSKKSGGVIAGIALFIALGASAVSAYLYTELQKYRSQADVLVEKSTSNLKAGMATNIESMGDKIQTLSSKLGSFEEEINDQADEFKKNVYVKIDTVNNQLSGKLDSLNQTLVARIDDQNRELETNTSALIIDATNTSASAFNSFSNKTSDELSVVSKEAKQARLVLSDSTNEKFEDINKKLTIISQVLAKTTEIATRGQRDWKLAEIEYLLRTGGYRVNLAGDTKSGVLALRAASERIHDLGDARYSPVRAQISEEVAELRQVGTPDIEGIAFELQKLSARADSLQLPLSDTEVMIETVKKDPSEIDPKAMANQLLQSLKELVKVEKSDGTPVKRPGKPSKEQLSASEGLRLNLQAARLSALRRDPQTFILQMETAEKYIQENYNQDSNLTKAYLEDLAVLKSQEIVPSVKKLGNALILFNQIHSKRGEN